MTDLARTVQRLADLEDIRTLTATYAHAVDKGPAGRTPDFDRLSSLFTADASWMMTGMPRPASGIDAIVAHLRQATASGDLAMHSFTNPVIAITGDTAQAEWLLWVAIKTDGKADLVFQREVLTYQRTDQGWRIKSLDLHFGTTLKG